MNAAAAHAREIFAVSEIASAIGWSKRRVQTALENIVRSGHKTVSGNAAPAWAIATLPDAIMAELERLKTVHRYRTAGAVLREPAKPWQPIVPLARVADDERRAAECLRAACSSALALPDDTSTAERARVAASAYQREFGGTVSHRHLQRLIQRTLDRDRGARDWRLEIFLSESAGPKEARAHPLPGFDFSDLASELAAVSNATAPTQEDRSYCWRKIVEWYGERTASGTAGTRLKRELCAYLLKATPRLANNEAAMRRNLNLKLVAVREQGVVALVDQRSVNSGRRHRAEDWKEDIALLCRHNRARTGKVSQAYRELHRGTAPGGLRFSEAFRKAFPYDVRSAKSRVPAFAREAARRDYILAESQILGGRLLQNRRASYHQDWSAEHSNEVHTADDVTADVYVHEYHELGAYEFEGRRFDVGRPQMVPMICDRTDCPLGCVVELTKQPTSHHVFTVVTKTWLNPEIGLPHIGVKFERGAFDALKVRALFDFTKIDERFLSAGIKLRLQQARGPRAKSAIERFAGRLHREMSHLAGYCGNNEKETFPATLRQFIETLKRVDQPRKLEVDPREMLLSKAEFDAEVRRACRLIAEEPQNGARLRGLSPSEAWTRSASGRPVHVLPDSLRYLLATQSFTRKATPDGFSLPLGKWDKRVYCGSERLGELVEEEVEVYLNPDLPEHVICIHRRSDPGGVEPFSVPLFIPLKPNGGASKQEFAAARKHRSAFMAPSRAAYLEFRPPSSLTIRNEKLASADA